jgi:4-coumarate--CoA ligase
LFGIILAGGIVSPANPTYTSAELKHQISDSTAKYVVTVGPMAGVAVEACTSCQVSLSNVFVLGDKPEGTTAFGDLLQKSSSQLVTYSQSPDDVVVIPYSSGTTGLPKGVMLTHYNLVANIVQVKTVNGDSIGPKDSFLGCLPFFHIYGLVVVLLTGLYRGNTVTVMTKFELELFLTTVQSQKVTTLHLVPPIILAMAKHPLVSKFDLSSVKTIMSGAAPLGAEMCKALNARLPKIALRQGYGMTELSPVSHFQRHDDIIYGSIGPLLCNQEAMIVDPDSLKSLPAGKVGELWVRGPNVMKGYWRRQDATSAMIVADGGWLRTGDMAVVTEDGHYYIVDRLKELIKYKGFQVAPAELEECLLTHPDVADCAVLGIPDDAAGELPKAYVVLKPQTNQKTNAEAIQKFVASKMAPHKQLRGGVRFVESIPKSASGKILRRVLKDEELKVSKIKAKL